MAFNEKRKCLWHAFNALDDQRFNSVPKSKLKVLTQNIATVLDQKNDGNSILDVAESTSLTLDEFLSFINEEVFEKLQDNDVFGSGDRLDRVDKLYKAKIDIDKVDDVCWMLCSKNYDRTNKIISDQDVFKLWRIFNFLAETDDCGDPLIPVVMDSDEVANVAEKYTEILGKNWNLKEFKRVFAEEIPYFSFSQFLNYIEVQCSESLRPSEVTLALKELYDDIICDVIKKGPLNKKGHTITNWKERWFVLTPTKLAYYSSSDLRDHKGEVKIHASSTVESMQNKSMSKANRFLVKGMDKSLEISAPDIRTKSAWVQAIESAIKHCAESGEAFQRAQFRNRKLSRDFRRAKLMDEEARKREAEDKARQERQELENKLTEEEARMKAASEMSEKERQLLEEQLKEEAEKRRKEQEQIEEQKRLLDAEKLARADVETRLEEESKLRELEHERLRELEELQKQLEKLLEEERQAKRDEEIVRNLQSRLLEEEFQKREELEYLKAQMEDSLESERQKREDLEGEREEQEMLLVEERKKLEALELERIAYDEKLKNAQLKLADAEKQKRKAVAQVRAHEKPIGLARLIEPRPNPLISHRGLGAFVAQDFRKTTKHSDDNDSDDAFTNDSESSIGKAEQDVPVSNNGCSDSGVDA